ncbi:MAG: InlB B-repeat-containing protein [Clostridia bacterium]|nr:InlB B-repeat-containing protein [Clostridia bacterium]
MIRNNSLFKKIIGFAASVSIVLSMVSPCFAAGSYQMNETPADYRLYTEEFVDGTTAGIERRNSIMCYLKEGEYAYFGSSMYNSQLDINFENKNADNHMDISVKDPAGNITKYDVIQNGEGHIKNPAQEEGGPNLTDTSDPLKYIPLSFVAAKTGTYTFTFYSKTGKRESPVVRKTTDAWGENGGTVAAWDITVADSEGNIIPGRTWANYLSVITGGAPNTCSLHTYVLTDDGVIYKVDLNEIAPNGFVFFANNQGFTDRGIAPKSIYHSFYDTDTNTAAMAGMEAENIAIHLPNAAESAAAKTFKIFFEEPDADLLTDIAPVPSEPKPITNLKFHGITDSTTHEGAGGEFSFETLNASTATLTIDFNEAISSAGISGYTGSGIVEITGAVTDGPNVFYWDGKDTTGETIPAGTFDMDKIKISAEPKQGEIHFPLLDVEGMYGGLTIERINGGNLIKDLDNPDCNAYDLYYNNNPLVYGTIEGAGHTPVPSGIHYLLSDGTKQSKITQPQYFDTSSPETISTLKAEGHIPVNSKKVSMKFTGDLETNKYNGGGNAAGIDIWTYFTAVDSTVSEKPMKDVIDGEAPTMTILPATSDLGSISGLVFYDSNNNQSYNLNDQDTVLPGIKVQLYKSSDKGNVFEREETVSGTSIKITYETTTDIYGTYHFTGVPAGQYIVKTVPGGYKCTTGNDYSSPENSDKPPLTVTAGKETRNSDIGYVTTDESPVTYTFRKVWGSSNPLSSVWVKLYTVDKNGEIKPYRLDPEMEELNDSNNWSYTFTGLSRNQKYFVEEYYKNGSNPVLIGRSPVFCANDFYWGSTAVYKQDVSSDAEKKENMASNARVYNLRFGMFTVDRCNYVVTLNNQQTYDSKEYYLRLGEEQSLNDFLSITGTRTNNVESIDPAKLTIVPASGSESLNYEVDPDNNRNLLWTPSGSTGTKKYKVTYDDVKFELTVHVYNGTADSYTLSGREIIDGITSGAAVVLQGSGKNLLLENDVYRLSSAADCSAQIAGIAYAGSEEAATPSALEYQTAVPVDNSGNPTGETFTVSAKGESGTLTLIQKKTSGFSSGDDTADYAEVSYLPGSTNPSGSKEVYYYKLIVRSPQAKGIGFGKNGESLDTSRGIVLYVPVTINYQFPYTVSYNTKGHGTTPASEMVPWGEKATEPADPTETGYTFGGWFEASDCSGSPFNFNSTLTENKILYAKWILNTYTVTFDVNGGTPVVEKKVIAHGQKLTEPSVSRTGYNLAGWDMSGGGKWDFSAPVTGALSLKAKWEPKSGISYNVKHYKESLEGGYVLADTVEHTGTTEEVVSYTAETYPGFTLDLSNRNTVSSGAVKGDGSLVLSLYYTRDSYNVNYSYTDNVSGAPAVGSQTFKYEEDAVLAADPVLPGYTFNGWTTGDVSTSGGAFKMPAKDVNVKGSWTINTYTVTWKNDDGTTIDAVTYKYGETPSHANPSKPSTVQYTYNFSGWTPEIAPVTAAAVYTAQYTPVVNQYAVVFNTQGKCSNPATQSVNYGAKASAPAAPSSTGWTFKGWYANEDCTGDAYNFTASVTGNITLYAKWEVAEYTITWLDCDNETVLATSTVRHGDVPVYPYAAPTRPSDAAKTYAFSTWSPALKEAYKDASYTALYTDSDRAYTVTWKNENGSIFTTTSALYNSIPSCTGTPEKAEDLTNTYVFKDWVPTVSAVRGDTFYTASFTVIPKKYGINFVDEKGNLLYSTACAIGVTPYYAGETPVKEANAQYSYEFDHWSPAIGPVTGSAVTYTTVFREITNEYTITWKGGDIADNAVTKPYGTPIEPPAGFTPVKTGNAEFSYEFTGWNPQIRETSIFTHDAEYEPVFKEIRNKYSVTWKN